ncbi:MAG TPA: TetR/AcrR family transcriptional regulator, partial [Bacteroidia bacterium]|nr:TetR/AcrR family transcriptional regulator [Bacteroidia bacterium]
ILAATNLTKGAIYGNFENKDEVAIAVYKYNIDLMAKKFKDAMQGKKNAADKLFAFIDYYRTNWKAIFERGGCPIQNASIEADDNAPFLKKHVQQSIKDWAVGFSTIIESGKKEGIFKKKIDSELYAYQLLIILEGGLMLGKIMNNQQILFDALDRMVGLVHTELKK